MPMSWEDDWPRLNHGKPLSLKSTARGLYLYDQPVKWRDTFETSKLQLGWYHKNTAVKPKSDYSLTARTGYLRLYGSPYKLSSPCPPTAVFRKQLHRQGTWRTRLSFQPD